MRKLFNRVKTDIDKIGFFPASSFKIPPFFNADEEWLEEIADKNDSFPKFNDLQKLAKTISLLFVHLNYVWCNQPPFCLLYLK
jgi:hypothetical protein